MKYKTHTLTSGMRVLHIPSASAVVYCGIAVAAGTRHEQPGQEGLAHFCEHLSFKGTERRSAVQIINALEGVGAELNAFTNKEDTMFYAAILRDHLPKAVDVLCDIVFHSQYPQAEMDKEVEVVCDEIDSYEDTPSELIYDEFESMLFSGHPLGHNILGTASQLRTYRRADALRFARRWYRPENTVFFASGDIDFGRLVRLLEKEMASVTVAPLGQESMPAHYAAAVPERHAAAAYHQTHVAMGCRAYAINDSRRWALYLMNNLLGGPGMNSRLNLSLRERHGLVYTVDSSMVSYSDAGMWMVYFGCDPHDADRCQWLVRRELDRLMQQPLTQRQLTAAKRQLSGQLAIASDSREQFALDFAKNFLHTGKERDLSDIMKHIDQLTAEDLQQVANELFAEECLTTLIFE